MTDRHIHIHTDTRAHKHRHAERERERESKTDTHSHTKEIETERERERQTVREKRNTHILTQKCAGTCIHTKTYIATYKHTRTHTHKHTQHQPLLPKGSFKNHYSDLELFPHDSIRYLGAFGLATMALGHSSCSGRDARALGGGLGVGSSIKWSGFK